jgi:serine/threonine protein kinase
VGPYEILAKLGAGGMGEVFRARDTRLDRDVAIKVLSDAFVKDPDRVTRFEREAKAIAALSHPNVLAIFDTGRHAAAGTEASVYSLYVVTELLQGETLRDRLAHGALPARKVVEYAVQIARGLAAAHERGLVHRDLKPENVFLLPDGHVKILDFGLARPITGVAGTGSTETVAAITDPGSVMGTVGYMAPEQIRGHAVDGRCDVFALGAVLYEMLSGKRAFFRETNAETMTAILKEDPPDLMPAHPGISPSLDRIIRHCLEKNPGERFQSARDVAFALESLSASGATPVTEDPRQKTSHRTLKTAAALAIVAGLAASAGYFGARQSPGATTPVTRLDMALPEGDVFRQANGQVSLAFSPDSRTLYYAAIRNGVSHVFRRRLDSSQAEPVAGTEDAHGVSVSSDGESLLVTTSRQGADAAVGGGWGIRRVPVSGGQAVAIGKPTSQILGVAVSAEGHILFGTHSSGLLRIANGADAELIVPVGDFGPPRFPVILPQGKGLIFTVGGVPVSNKIALLKTGDTSPTILSTGTNAVYLDTGHLLFWRDGGLWAARFDLATLSLTAEAVPVVEDVAVRGNGRAGFAVAPNGTLAYVEATPVAERTLVWVNQKGEETPLKAKAGPFSSPRLSPDGNRVILAYRNDATEDLWIHDISRSVTERFVAEPVSEWSADCTADGERVAFTSRRDGPFKLYSKRANGLGDIEPVAHSDGVAAILGRDGKDLLILSRGVGRLDLTTGTVTPLWREPSIGEAELSPDRKWIAYSAGLEDGRRQIWVRPYPAVDANRWRISVDGGTSPRWSPDGRTLYFLDSNRMMAVKLRPGPTFSAEPPTVLFKGPYLSDFVVAKDGRFLMIKAPVVTDTGERRIVVVLNWFTELKSRLSQK